MTHRTRIAALVVAAAALTGCGDDDGGTVRNVGDEGSGPVSGSGSGSVSGSGSGSVSGSGSGSGSGSTAETTTTAP